MEVLPLPLKALELYPQFIIYKLIPSKDRPGKTDKIPLDYRTGNAANPHDKTVRSDFGAVALAAARFGEGHGVGFVFTVDDPFWFLDIDDCLQADNTWSPLALELCGLFPNAAIEVSSSGRGLHIFGTGKTPQHKTKNIELKIEFYTENRFVALTGIHAIGDIRNDFTAQLPDFINKYFSGVLHIANQSGSWSTSPVPEWNGPIDDTVLIDRALKSTSSKAVFGTSASFYDLWTGNFSVLEKVYNSDESSYDLALANHLSFWTGKDCERMLRLIKQSQLVRDKWNREDYLQRTIINACASTETVLRDPLIEKPLPGVIPTTPTIKSTTGFLTIDQQLELFKGCVYITDEHKILTLGGILLKPDQFRVIYGGYSFPMDLTNERVVRNAWECFTESQAFKSPRADSSCFMPNRKPGELINDNGRVLANIYWPIETPRKKGDPHFFLDHLSRILPDERDRTILLSYMSACVQHKGIKFQWAPILQGVEGNGKTLCTLCVGFAIGDRYVHYPKAAEIAAKFNDWMYKKIFIGVEDIYVPDSQREVMEALKPMITSSRLEIEGKNKDKITLGVCCNFILNSNHKDGLRKTRNDRRFAPLYTAQQEESDLIKDGLTPDYFYNYINWLEEDGYAIVSELLHTYKIPDEFNPATKCKRAPITSSTEIAIKEGLGSVEQEIMEAVESELIGFKYPWISSIALDNLLTRLGLARRVSHNRRRTILHSLGYDLHPALNEGRVNIHILPDNGRPRLYVHRKSPAYSIKTPAQVLSEYTNAQQAR